MNYNKENDAINDLNSAYELIRKIGSEALSYQPEVAEQPQVEVQPQLPKENEWSLLGKSFLRGLVDPTAGAGTYLKQKGFDNALTNWMSESSYDDLTKGTSMQIGDYAKLGKDRSVYDAWLNWGNEATRMNIADTIGGGIGSMLNFIGVGKLAGLATGQVLKQGAKVLAKNVATTGAEEVAKATVKEGAWQTVGKTLKNNATDIAGGAMAGLYEGAGNIGSTIKDMWNPNNLNPATGKPYTEQGINEAVSRYESQQLPMDALLGSVQLGALFGKTGIPKAIRNIENPVGRTLGTGAVRMGVPALEEGYQELLQTRGQNDMMNPTGEGFFSRLSFIPRNAEERDAMIAGALIGGGTGGAMSLYNRYQEGKAADFQNQVNELMHGVPFQNKITHNNLADIVETVETGAGTNPVLKTLVEANANLPLSQRAAAYSKSLSEMEELPTEVAGLASGKTLDKRMYAQNKTQEINELDKLQRVMNSYSNEDTTSLSMPQAKEKLSYLRNAPKAEIESMVNNGQFVPDEVLIKNGMKTPNHIRAERASELHSSVNQIINDTSLSDDHKAKKIYDIITSNAHEAGNAYVEAKRLATAKDVGKGAIKEADYVRAEENARNQDYILDSLEQTPELQELANRIQNPTLKERFNQLLTSNVSPVSRVVMNKFLTNKDAFKNVEDFNTKINKLGTRTSFFTQNNEQSQRMFRDLQEGYDIRGAEHGVVKTPTGRVVAHWNIFDNSIQTGKHESSHIMDALAGHISLRSNLVKDFVKTNAGNIVNLYIENQRALGNENVDVQQLTQELSSGNFASDLSKSLVREVLADISMGKDYVLKDGKYVSLKEETDKVASGLREMMETHEGMKKFVNWFVDGTSKSYARVLQQNIKDMPVGQNINDTAYLRYQVDELGASKPLNKSLELVSIYHKQRMIKKFNQFYSNPDLFNQSKIEMGYHNNGELAITFDNSLTIPLKNIQQSSTVTKLKQNNIDVNYNYLMTNLQQLANKERDRLQNYYLTLEPLVNSFGEKLLRSLNVNLNSNSLTTSQSRIWKTHILMSLSSGPLRLKLQNILGETNEIVADSNYEISALLILSDLKKNEKIKDFFKLEQIPQTFGIQYQFYVPFIKSDLTNGLYNTDIFVIDNDNNLKIYEVKPGYEIVSNKNVQSKANKIKQYLDFYNNKNELFRDMIKNGIDIDNSQLSDEQKNVLMAFIKTLDEIKKYSKKTLESDIQDIKYSFFDESDIQNYFTQENKDGIKYSDFVSNKMKEMNDNYKKHISGKNMNKVLSLRKQLDNIEIEGNQIKKQIKKLQEKKKIKYDDLLDTELKVNQTRLIELRENRIDIIEKLKEMDMWNLGSDMITDENYNRWKPLHKNLITGIYVDENVQEAKEKLSTQYPLSLYRGFKKTSELFTNMRNIIQNSPQKKFANNSQGLQQLKNVFKKAGLKDTAIETANLEEVFKEVSEFKDLPNNVVTAEAVDYWLQRFKPIVAIRSTSHQTRFMKPEYNVTLNGYKETSYHAQSENTPYILPSPHSFYFTDQNTSDRFAHARSSMAFARFEDGTNNGYVHLIEEVQSDDAGFATNSKKSWPNKIKELQSKIDGIAKLKIQEANIELQGDDNNGKIFINGIEYGIYEPDWRGEGLDIYIENNYIYLNEIGNRKLINKQDVLDYLNKPESRRDVYKVLIDEIGGLGIEKDLLQRLIDESNEYGTKTLTRKDFDALNDWVTPVLKDQILQALENEESNGIAITSPDVQAVRWAEPDKAPKPEAYQFYNTYFKQIGQILKKYIPNIKPTRFTVGDNKLNGYMFDKNLDRKDVRERIENDGIAYRAKKPGGLNPQANRNMLTDVREVVFTQSSQQFQRNQDAMQTLRNAGWTENRNPNRDVVFSRPNPEPSHNRRRIITGLIADETKERIVDYKSIEGIKEQVFRMWDNIQTNWVEELQPLKALGREIPQMYDIYEDAWIAQRGWTGKVKKLIEFGVQSYDLHDGQGRVDIKPLKDILQNINEEEINDLDNYLIAKRVIDLSNRNEPIQEAMTVTEAQDIIRNVRPTFVQAQKDLVNLQRYLLRQLVESGIIKESSYQHFINVDPNYVPLFKDFGEEELQGAVGQINGRSFVNVSSPIKKIKGDTQHDTLSPVQSILKHMYQFHSLAERNKVGQKFVDLRSLPHMQDILYSVSGPTDRTDNVFSVWENGERKYYETTRDLYNALTSINTRQADLVLTMLQKPAHWLRMGATMSPDFAIRNFVRDQFTAWLFSKSGYLPFVDAIRGVAHIAKKDAIYQQYLSSGAAHADIVSLDRNYLQKNVRQMVRSENVWKKVTKNPVTIARAIYETFGKAGSYFRDVSQNLEMATRVAEFENALKKGKTEKQAALESRDITLDFSRAGTVGKKINRYIAFFNASIQGTDKLRREIISRPGTMAFRFGMIALVSAAIWYMNHDDDRVKELPRWQKDLFWIFPSKDYLVRIPKPFEPGLIFGTGTERFLSWWKDNDPNAWKAFGKTLLGGMTPNIMFTALQPAMEAATNYSIFRERNIVPQAEEKFAPYMQYGPYTSELAKTVGKTFNWSPRKVDHLIQGYFGTMGGTVLKTSTQATNAVTGKQLPDQRANEWVPGLTAFTATPYQSPQTIQDLYEREKELEQIRNEVKAKNKTVKEYPMSEHERLKTAIDTIGKMNKMAKEIIADNKLSSEEKRSRLDKIKLKELEIAQKAMKKN